MKLKPSLIRKLFKIMPFGLIWGLFGLLYVLIEYGLLGDSKIYPSTQNPYLSASSLMLTPIGSSLLGLLLGTIEVVFLNNLFAARPFWQKIFFKTVFYLVAIITLLIILTLFTNSIALSLPFFHADVINSVLQFFLNFAFWSIVIYGAFIAMITLFVHEVSEYLGGNIFNNFFIGKYHQPREEERVFMFLDMKASTTIAEQLGHLKFFRLLNKYYADITDAIVQTQGEVYQYAGDEIIVSWDFKKGIASNNCIQCFFTIKDIFQRLTNNYVAEFGLVPGFKAGFHYGTVTTGEIGVLKKEIFFTGDVLNTTARIQATCNEVGTDILVSGQLIENLMLNDDFQLIDIGERELKGKREKIQLFSINKK